MKSEKTQILRGLFRSAALTLPRGPTAVLGGFKAAPPRAEGGGS